jgi:energy-coupling factor transport system permease protein
LIFLSAIFNASFSHFGETILFIIPSWIPIIGGSITLEAIIYGAINGMVLFAILWTFLIINQALSPRQIMILVPKAFYPVSVITSIAITFIPSTIHYYNQVREAQSIRGHQVRGLRDWVPLLIPVLIGGLEKATLLAESMTARGFASSNKEKHSTLSRFGLLLGVVLIIIGTIIHLNQSPQLISNTFLITGSFLILLILWLLGRNNKRTNFLPEKWRGGDLLVIASLGFLVVIIFIPLPFIDYVSLTYDVYPELTIPGFEPWLGIALLILLSPVLFLSNREITPAA